MDGVIGIFARQVAKNKREVPLMSKAIFLKLLAAYHAEPAIQDLLSEPEAAFSKDGETAELHIREDQIEDYLIILLKIALDKEAGELERERVLRHDFETKYEELKKAERFDNALANQRLIEQKECEDAKRELHNVSLSVEKLKLHNEKLSGELIASVKREKALEHRLLIQSNELADAFHAKLKASREAAIDALNGHSESLIKELMRDIPDKGEIAELVDRLRTSVSINL